MTRSQSPLNSRTWKVVGDPNWVAAANVQSPPAGLNVAGGLAKAAMPPTAVATTTGSKEVGRGTPARGSTGAAGASGTGAMVVGEATTLVPRVLVGIVVVGRTARTVVEVEFDASVELVEVGPSAMTPSEGLPSSLPQATSNPGNTASINVSPKRRNVPPCVMVGILAVRRLARIGQKLSRQGKRWGSAVLVAQELLERFAQFVR